MKKLVTISGCPGSGKTTALNFFKYLYTSIFKDIKPIFFREHTTRTERPYEFINPDKIFVSDSDFEKKIGKYRYVNSVGDKYGIDENELNAAFDQSNLIITLIADNILDKLKDDYKSTINFESILINTDKEYCIERIKSEKQPLEIERTRLYRIKVNSLRSNKFSIIINNNNSIEEFKNLLFETALKINKSVA